MLSVATVGRAGAPSNRGWAALRRILLISKLMASVVPLLMRSGDEGGQEFGEPDGDRAGQSAQFGYARNQGRFILLVDHLDLQIAGVCHAERQCHFARLATVEHPLGQPADDEPRPHARCTQEASASSKSLTKYPIWRTAPGSGDVDIS